MAKTKNEQTDLFTRLDTIRLTVESCCEAGTMSKYEVAKKQKQMVAAYVWSDVVLNDSNTSIVEQFWKNPMKSAIIGRDGTDRLGKYTVLYTSDLSAITLYLNALDLIDEVLFRHTTGNGIDSSPDMSIQFKQASEDALCCINHAFDLQKSRVRFSGIVSFSIQTNFFKLETNQANGLIKLINEVTPVWLMEAKFFDPTSKSAESAKDSWYHILPGTRTGEHSAIHADGAIEPITAYYIRYSVN